MPEHQRLVRALLAATTLLLAACAAPVRDDAPASPASPAANAPNEMTPPRIEEPRTPRPASAEEPTLAPPESESPGTQASAVVVEPSLWQAIVERHAFVDCDTPSPAVRRWQRIYAQSPKRHAEAMTAAAPWIAYVADELARRNLPSEFVWLPFVESRYQAFRTRGDRPAGAWQIMPATARWRGLRITDDYDGRLDFVAATRAALDLIEHLALTFDRDWSLVTMSYNAGEFRIKGAMDRARKAGKSIQAEHLAVSPITHEHLVKLRALACVAARPDSVELTLPAFDRRDELVPIALPHAMNTAQLAALSGVPVAQWQKWNPAWRHGHVEGGSFILLPEHLAATSAAAIANAAPEPIQRRAREPGNDGTRVHVVRSGESAWQIARHHRVTLAALLVANGLTAKSLLRPGQRLRLP